MPASARGTRPSGSRNAEALRILVIGGAEQDQRAHATVCHFPRLEHDFIH